MFKPSFSSQQFPDVPDFGPEHYPDVTDDFNRTKFNIINDLQTTSRQHGDPGVHQAIYKNFQPGGKWDITRQPEFPGYGQDGSPRYGKYGNGAASGQFLKQHLFGNVLGAMGYDLPNSKRPKSQRSFPTEFMPSHLIDNDHIQTGIDSWHDGDKAAWQNSLVQPTNYKPSHILVALPEHKSGGTPPIAPVYNHRPDQLEYFNGSYPHTQQLLLASNDANDIASDSPIGLPRNDSVTSRTGKPGDAQPYRLPETELHPLADYSNTTSSMAQPEKVYHAGVRMDVANPQSRIVELDATANMPETVKQTIQDVRKYQQQGVMSPQQAQTLIDNTKLHYLDKQRQENKQALESQSSLLQKELAKIKSGTPDDYQNALFGLQAQAKQQLEEMTQFQHDLEHYGSDALNQAGRFGQQAWDVTSKTGMGTGKGVLNTLSVGNGPAPGKGEEFGYAIGDTLGTIGATTGIMASTGGFGTPLAFSYGALKDYNQQIRENGRADIGASLLGGALNVVPGMGAGKAASGIAAKGTGQLLKKELKNLAIDYSSGLAGQVQNQLHETGEIDLHNLDYRPSAEQLIGIIPNKHFPGMSKLDDTNSLHYVPKTNPYIVKNQQELEEYLQSAHNYTPEQLIQTHNKQLIIPEHRPFEDRPIWSPGDVNEPIKNLFMHTNKSNHASALGLSKGDARYVTKTHEFLNDLPSDTRLIVDPYQERLVYYTEKIHPQGRGVYAVEGYSQNPYIDKAPRTVFTENLPYFLNQDRDYLKYPKHANQYTREQLLEEFPLYARRNY